MSKRQREPAYETFEFPSAFWFGWDICIAVVYVAFAAVVLGDESWLARLIAVGMVVNAALACRNAIQSRGYQLEWRRR